MKAEGLHVLQLLVWHCLFSLHLILLVHIISRFSAPSSHNKKLSYCSCSFIIIHWSLSDGERLEAKMRDGANMRQKYVIAITTRTLPTYRERGGGRKGPRPSRAYWIGFMNARNYKYNSSNSPRNWTELVQ